MSKPHQPDHDIVKVHVTPLGGLYVHERELLRSKGAREMMAKMDRILQREELVSQKRGPSPRRPADPSSRAVNLGRHRSCC